MARHLTKKHKIKLSIAQKKRYLEGRNPTTFKKGHVPTPKMRAKMGVKGKENHFWKDGRTTNRKLYQANWREKNRKKMRKYFRKWKKEHRQKVNIYTVNYRAKLKKAKGSFSEAEWEAKKRKYKNKCAICGKRKKLTVDHIIPISRGGTNWISNILPLCEKCNYSKQDRFFEEFILTRLMSPKKNTSWHAICNKYLPEGKREKKECEHEWMEVCRKCGQKRI